jgi:hypothetical protein
MSLQGPDLYLLLRIRILLYTSKNIKKNLGFYYFIYLSGWAGYIQDTVVFYIKEKKDMVIGSQLYEIKKMPQIRI